MSGWIKLDKDLPGSIRFRRLVNRWRATGNALVTRDERDVTLCLGALVRLWFYVDTHVNSSNTIEATFEEINHLVEVPQFAQCMPEEWLREAGEGYLELPEFIEKNGSETQRRMSNAERQARFRQRKKEGDVTRVSRRVTASNTSRPDQIRPDQTKNVERARGTGRNGDHDPDGSHTLTEALKAIYPPGTYRASNWILAQRELSKLLDGGEHPDTLIALARAFRSQQDAKGSTGTQFVLSPEKFFGPDGHWRGPFPLPASRADTRLAGNISAAEEFLRRTEPAA